MRYPARQSGLMYLAMLFTVAISAVVVAGQSSWWSLERQRERERELLFVGDQFRQAIASYYESSSPAVKRYPASLEDLMWDRRVWPPQRHLRRIYADPMTGEGRWGQVLAPDGGVMGVHSLSQALPLKRSGFSDTESEFADKSYYSEWVFLYRGEQTRYVPPTMLKWGSSSAPSKREAER